MKSIQLLFSVAALSVAGIAAASSAAGPDVRSVVVKYGDLNLATQVGVARLHKRLHNAAESVCSPLNSHMLSRRDHYAECVADAVQRGIADVGNDNLSKYRTGRATRTQAFASN